MRLIALSDLHGYFAPDRGFREPHMPPHQEGDVLIFAGDATRYGSRDELRQFNDWLRGLPYAFKLVIAGNHDSCWEKHPEECRRILTAAMYLQDQAIIINGIHFYGSPWTPNYYDWSFMKQRRSKELADVWANVPDDTDVLITHGPPYGILDEARDVDKSGDETLARRVMEIQPRHHIFGHIHEGHGGRLLDGTHYHNVAICTIAYEPINPVTVINLEV